MEEDASKDDEERRFYRERPEAVRVRVEEREAIRLRDRPQNPGKHNHGTNRSDRSGTGRPGPLNGIAHERRPHKMSIKGAGA
jgi:hypothetical protein